MSVSVGSGSDTAPSGRSMPASSGASWRREPLVGWVARVNDAAGGELRVVGDVGDVEHGSDAGVGLPEQGDPLVPVPGGEGCGEGSPDGGLGRVVELVRRQLGTAESPAQVGEELRLDGAHGHPFAVAGLVRAVAGEAAGKNVVARLRSGAEGQVLVDRERHEGEHTLGHRDVEVGAGAGRGPTYQRGRDGQGGLHAAGGGVGDGGAGDGWCTIDTRSTHGQEPAHGQVVDVVAGPVGVRPVLAVAAGRAVDDARIARARPRAYPMPSRSTTPGRKLSITTSALVGQGEKGVPAAVILEVDQDPAHAAVTAVGEEPRIIGCASPLRAPHPILITSAP